MRTTVTETDTQTLPTETRTVGTFINECGCLQRTGEVQNRCKWKYIMKHARNRHDNALRQQSITTLWMLSRHMLFVRCLYSSKANAATQTPKKMGQPKVRNISSQVTPEQSTVEIQTVNYSLYTVKTMGRNRIKQSDEVLERSGT